MKGGGTAGQLDSADGTAGQLDSADALSLRNI
jgi:hypothetical protein